MPALYIGRKAGEGKAEAASGLPCNFGTDLVAEGRLTFF